MGAIKNSTKYLFSATNSNKIRSVVNKESPVTKHLNVTKIDFARMFPRIITDLALVNTI